MVRLITEFEENFYLTYPHNNVFADGGRALILGRNTGQESSLWKFNLADGKRAQLCSFARERQLEKMLWSDSAFDAGAVVTIADDQVWVINLRDDVKPRAVASAPDGAWFHPIPAIRADGRRIVCGLHRPGRYETLLIDLESGQQKILFEKPWMTDHFHFCPFDPEWIGFSHEGKCWEVMDRVWAWHPTQAPAGRCCFDQMASNPARTLYVGHERWSFHDLSVMVVAYGEGPARPRGIYEAFADGRPQKLVSEGDRDMHLDVSRDGRWVAIDTSGPHDAPGKGWENSNGISDILVLNCATGERRVVARSTIVFHPSHPHPVFSPDGRTIYFNEGTPDGSRNRVCAVENPFLA